MVQSYWTILISVRAWHDVAEPDRLFFGMVPTILNKDKSFALRSSYFKLTEYPALLAGKPDIRQNTDFDMRPHTVHKKGRISSQAGYLVHT